MCPIIGVVPIGQLLVGCLLALVVDGIDSRATIAKRSQSSFIMFTKHVGMCESNKCLRYLTEYGCVDDYVDDSDRQLMYTINEQLLNWNETDRNIDAPLRFTDEQYWMWERSAFEMVLSER